MDIRRLDDLLSAKRWRDLGQIVHRLKGAARMVGAQELIVATSAYEVGLDQAVEDEEARVRAVAVHLAIGRQEFGP
ncbi:Hpt domain-containing protein [Pseudomonas sp. Irchel s3a18]|uniref:Hpt domain-containing protein n=1 Tax=Pseudomonas sp. Irchel s3a18 TaxID=2009053 RepID=UPI000BA38B58